MDREDIGVPDAGEPARLVEPAACASFQRCWGCGAQLERDLSLECGIPCAPDFAEGALAQLLDRAQRPPGEKRLRGSAFVPPGLGGGLTMQGRDGFDHAKLAEP